MRRIDEQQLDVFSYVSPEQRVPEDHPLRLLRAMTDGALQRLQTPVQQPRQPPVRTLILGCTGKSEERSQRLWP
jgi:hypothetical protein